MGVQRVIHCDGPSHADTPEGIDPDDGCGWRVSTAAPDPYVPASFIRIVEGQPKGCDDNVLWFCSWACVMRFAAAQPEPIVVDGEAGD